LLAIGLTGGIGAGKSTVAAMLGALGAVVVDADDLARQAIAPGGGAHDAVAGLFPEVSRLADGNFDRAELAARIFLDPAARAAMEKAVHPVVRSAMEEVLAGWRHSARVVVLVLPLLADRSAAPALDGVVVVDLPEEQALARLIGQRGMSETDARARISSQIDRPTRLRLADRVIDNSEGREQLRLAVETLWKRLADGRLGRGGPETDH
jgi:dephospho-CoA kinase